MLVFLSFLRHFKHLSAILGPARLYSDSLLHFEGDLCVIVGQRNRTECVAQGQQQEVVAFHSPNCNLKSKGPEKRKATLESAKPEDYD